MLYIYIYLYIYISRVFPIGGHEGNPPSWIPSWESSKNLLIHPAPGTISSPTKG